MMKIKKNSENPTFFYGGVYLIIAKNANVIYNAFGQLKRNGEQKYD